MDREKTAEKIRKDLNEEKTELKQILNEELGLFKHDEKLFETEDLEKDREETFTFDFSEESDTVVMEEKKEKGRWFRKKAKKDTVQNKPAEKFVIDE